MIATIQDLPHKLVYDIQPYEISLYTFIDGQDILNGKNKNIEIIQCYFKVTMLLRNSNSTFDDLWQTHNKRPKVCIF